MVLKRVLPCAASIAVTRNPPTLLRLDAVVPLWRMVMGSLYCNAEMVGICGVGGPEVLDIGWGV